MTMAHDLSELLRRRKWKCDACGKVDFWGPGWVNMSSLLVEDACPADCITVCCENCLGAAEKKIKSGEWQEPKITRHGYTVTVKAERKGY